MMPINKLLLQKGNPAQDASAATPHNLRDTQKHSCAFCPGAGAAARDMSERVDAASLFDLSGRRKYLSADERDRFITAAATFSPKIEALCLLLHFTGCRISEALALRPMHLDAAQNVVILQTLKQRRRGVFRMMPLPADLVRRLCGLRPMTNAPFFSWHRTTAWEKVTAVMDRAGISGPQACPRGVRHGFGVVAISAGVPITLVQRWLGHSRLETTSIYLAITGPEERDYAAKLWRKSELSAPHITRKEAA